MGRALPTYLACLVVAACGEPAFAPRHLDDGWEISSAADQGLSESTVEAAYRDAEALAHLYSLVVVKNGFLVAERYFDGHSPESAFPTASATKSYTSALAGLALREGVLTSLDQRLVDFFPEFAGQTYDARKDDITLEQMLQMRAGYPYDGGRSYLTSLHGSGDWLPYLLSFPLETDPGSAWAYSNLTAPALGMVLARAAGTTLLDFANAQLFGPLGVTIRSWPRDSRGFYYGSGDMAFTSRDLARFGLLYLNNGVLDGREILAEGWVDASWHDYSVTTYAMYGYYFRDLRYGYLWWHADVGGWDVHYAAGHGGQIVAVVPALDLVVVSTAESGDYSETAWPKERATFDLVGRFIASQ